MTGPKGNREFCFSEKGLKEKKFTVFLGTSHLVLIGLGIELRTASNFSLKEWCILLVL